MRYSRTHDRAIATQCHHKTRAGFVARERPMLIEEVCNCGVCLARLLHVGEEGIPVLPCPPRREVPVLTRARPVWPGHGVSLRDPSRVPLRIVCPELWPHLGVQLSWETRESQRNVRPGTEASPLILPIEVSGSLRARRGEGGCGQHGYRPGIELALVCNHAISSTASEQPKSQSDSPRIGVGAPINT